MEIIDKRERQKNKYRKKPRSGASYSENVRAKQFCYAIKLGFIKIICKALILKLNLELALSIILKKENYTSQINGVAMSSPLAPVHTNICMGF